MEQIKINLIRIKTVKNGYTVEGVMSPNTRFNETLVFESFESLVKWMEENFKVEERTVSLQE